MPPGISRVIDPSQPQVAELNEQSIVFRIHGLPDGDARVAYKNAELDLRQYKKLRMFVHAEEIPGDLLNDNDLTAFIRLGSDYKDNFYEYEVPLVLTPPRNYNDDNEADRRMVWPDENVFEIDLEKLVDIKRERDLAIQEDPFEYSKTKVYRRFDGRYKVKIRGTPNLSNIRTIMLGVRNPSDSDNQFDNDGLPKSAEIWFNELRLTDFNNKGGWAANTRVQAKLADLGSLSVAGSTIQPGFGSIEQKVEERKKEQINQYDISSNVELGKLFPEKTKVTIPLFVGVSQSVTNPEYYPKEPDRLLKDVIKEAQTNAEKEKIKKVSQDRTERKSINFTNVRVAKELKKFKILSPANLSISAGYSDVKSSNYKVDRNDIIKYRAGINYSYNARAKSITPFRKSKTLRSPYLRLIKDFNFTPYPSSVTFRTDIDRYYNEIKLRNVFDDRVIKIDSTVNKDFTWNRFYDLQWDITRSLKFGFSATNTARIDEPAGAYDLFREGDRKHWSDSVWSNILRGGRNSNYNHNINLSYSLPINKIPLFAWISSSARYNARFNWDRGPIFQGDYNLGHNLRNSNEIQFSGQANLGNLYSKVGFIKKIENKYRKGKKEEDKRYKTVTYSKRIFVKANQPKNIIHKLGTDDIKVTVIDANGNEIKVNSDIVSENKIIITADQDYTGITVNIEGKIEKGENPLVFFAENSVRFLTGIKNISVTYRISGGTMLMGYMPETDIVGMNTSVPFNGAPGWPFILGWQETSFVKQAALNGWLTTDSAFSNPYNMTKTENFNFRSTFEPFRGFRIDISASRTYSENVSEYFMYDWNTNNGTFNFVNRVTNGNFSMSVITIGSAFEVIKSDDLKSIYFERFKNYRKIISGRLHNRRVESSGLGYRGSVEQYVEPGYQDGYGSTSSQVLISAFLAAYTGKDPNNIKLETFPGYLSMMPNWRFNFDGLSRIPFIQNIFRSVNISHSYQSTFNIGSYTTYVDLEFEDDGLTYIRDFQNNFYPEFQINAVSINEKISPLINVDVTWNNNLITRFEISKSRILALGLANNQLTETKNNDLVIGTGYRFKEVPLKINEKTYKSDLNVRIDLSIRDNKTLIRNLAQLADDEVTQITTGQKVFKINATADYVLNPRFNVQLFFDRTLNKPYTSRSFLTADTNIGFSIRFTLQ